MTTLVWLIIMSTWQWNREITSGVYKEKPPAMLPSVNEAELIAAARKGNTAAWEALVSAHQEPVFRLAYLLLGDPDDAQDVAQETFIRAWGALPRFDDSLPLRPWLLRIASNLAKNRLRSLGRFLTALTRFGRQPALPSPDPDDPDLLWQAIRRLDEQHQQALYLRYFLEMPEVEMAQVLNIAPGTVKSRLHRALKALREIIIRYYPDLQPGFASDPALRGEK
jgi:RNA polymerase sigma-70 factor (ECF subfamily)